MANAVVKETREGFYFNFPENRFYIIRWLKDGGWHLYPKKDGQLPEGYASEEEAKNAKGWMIDISLGNAKIVTGSEASKYPVPKRW